ncbi:hypothetical protein VTN02DRAFT_1167 [Thermoascus thermophilus]
MRKAPCRISQHPTAVQRRYCLGLWPLRSTCLGHRCHCGRNDPFSARTAGRVDLLVGGGWQLAAGSSQSPFDQPPHSNHAVGR